MPFAGFYPCIDQAAPVRLALHLGRVEDPCTESRVFIEVQVRDKRVFRTSSGLLLSHLHIASRSQIGQPNKYLVSWRLFQIDFNDLLAKDVFSHCRDANSLSTMRISTNKHTAARFLNLFKRRVSSFCNKVAAKLLQTRPQVVTILAHITTVCLFDLDGDSEAKHALRVCGKTCIRRQENQYGATLLPAGASLLSYIHGSLEFMESVYFHGETCSICLNRFDDEVSDVIKASCGHAFHSRCLIPWFNKVGTCPLCRYGMKLYITRSGAGLPAPGERRRPHSSQDPKLQLQDAQTRMKTYADAQTLLQDSHSKSTNLVNCV